MPTFLYTVLPALLAVQLALPALAQQQNPQYCADGFYYPDYVDPVNFPPSNSDPISIKFGWNSECIFNNFYFSMTDPASKSYYCYRFSDLEDEGFFVTCDGLVNNQLSTDPGYTLTTTVTDDNENVGTTSISFTVTHDPDAPAMSPGVIRRRRAERAGQIAPYAVEAACPAQHRLCNVGKDGAPSWKCLDVQDELTSCGGCPGEGRDCSDIEGAMTAECVAGSCVVDVCDDDYFVALNRTMCVKYLE